MTLLKVPLKRLIKDYASISVNVDNFIKII